MNDKPVLLALTSLEWVYLAPDIYDYLRAFGGKGRSRKLKEKFLLPSFGMQGIKESEFDQYMAAHINYIDTEVEHDGGRIEQAAREIKQRGKYAG